KNKPDKFDIYIQRNKISSDSVSASVMFSTNSGETQEISLFILNFPEEKIRLDYNVEDAEYDYVNDRLILLSDSYSHFIEIYDLQEDKFHRIELNNYPYHLSVSKDGDYAIAGIQSSTEYISYINLNDLRFEGEFSVSYDVNDIVAAPDKMAYIFPRYNNNEIGKLNLSNGNFSAYQFNQIGDNLIAKLHPSGKYIYAVNNYSRLIKFDIRSAIPQLLYSTSSYDMDNKLWLSKDGTEIFTKNKKILHIDPTLQGDDITSVSNLTFADNYLYFIEQSSLFDEYYLITTNNYYSSSHSESDRILVYNSNFAQDRIINLEKFYYIQQGQHSYSFADASAEYVFSSSDGSKIIVVSMSAFNYYDNWGIEIIEK
ncbi:MAG: hypothetical protein B6D61_04650, partial [Bacteroidetes bacterium 4484_249]